MNHVETLQLTIREELEAARGRPEFVWRHLAFLVHPEQDWQSLISQCLSSLHTAAGDLHDNTTFRPLSQYPFLLATGRAQDWLFELASMVEAPQEANANKMWRLLAAGYRRAALEKVLDMFRQVPFTTLAVEQVHASFFDNQKVPSQP